jgi:hypothetical protein
LRHGGRVAATGDAVRELAPPLNGRPTSVLIVALDHLADGDADAVIVANSNGIGPALLARDNRKRRLVMQIVRIGLNLANMFS